jgi:O-acetyl-ADP-ribose deacetylase (regulator of RNase III)
MELLEVKGDLFDSGDNMAHCVSSDFKMGKGIALQFRNKFGGIDDLLAQGIHTGDVAILHPDHRYLYYLVTKERYYHKPTYESIYSCIESLKNHMVTHNLETLSIPRIGCGLDRLVWSRVKEMILDIFKDTSIKITVYTL